jgi:dolichol kinase
MVFQEFPIALFGAVIASIIELLPMPLDDNLAIPIFCGGILWAGFF